MFGIRPDGRRVKKMDPIVRMTPIIMPNRNDAQVFVKQLIDYSAIEDYIKKKRESGQQLSRMNLVVAAFVRTVFHMPEFNRFVMNKQVYNRNELCVSYSMLKEKTGDELLETTVKIHFNPEDTLFQVAEKMNQAVAENRSLKVKNLTDRIAGFFLSIPFLPSLAFSLVRLLDRYGLLPKVILDASPFHTSMFITNMASIRMNYVYHHIYNFGTTGIFISMGKKETRLDLDKEGEVVKKSLLPLGIVIDERICSGAVYARGLAIMERYLRTPQLLEKEPERAPAQCTDRTKTEIS